MNAKERLAAIGNETYLEGMAKHIEAVCLIQQSARIEQLARILSEEQAQACVDRFTERRLEASACVQDALDALVPKPTSEI